MLKILAIIIICGSAGYLIYTQNILGIQDIIAPVISTISNQTLENPAAVAMGAIPAITAVGTLAWKAVSSIKDRAKDEVNEISVNANKQVQAASSQVTNLTEQKDLLQAKITELENIPNDSQTLMETINLKDTEIEKLRTSNQTLMDALKRDKLEANEIITKYIAV